MNNRKKYLAGSTVLKVKDSLSLALAKSQSTDEPILIEEGHEHSAVIYNILQYGKLYYGIAQGEAFEPKQTKILQTKNYFSGYSIGQVKDAINSSSRSKTDSSVAKDNRQPRLIQGNYHDFNIIDFEEKYFGLARKEGEFDIEKFHRNEYIQCYQATTADEIRNIIDKIVACSNQSRDPLLVEEGYLSHNIVLFGKKYYAVLRDGEPFNTNLT